MEGLNLIQFDEVALNHDAALLDQDDDDDEILNGDQDEFTNTSPNPVDQHCSSSSASPLSVPDEVVVDTQSISASSLPPVSAIRPPRPPPTTHLPPPEVSATDDPDVSARWHRQNSRLCLGLGVSQIVIGTACVALAIASVAMRVNLYMINHGMWGGLTLIACGIVGVMAARVHIFNRVVFYMVLSILSSCASTAVFAVSMVACSDVSTKALNKYRCSINVTGLCDDSPATTISLAIHLVMGMVAIIGLTFTLISFGITAKLVSILCRRPPTNSNLSPTCLQLSRSTDGAVTANFVDNPFRFHERPPEYSPAEPPPSYSTVTSRQIESGDK